MRHSEHLALNEMQLGGLERFVGTLREVYGQRLREITAFGSRVAGTANVSSDLDLVVVLNDGDWDPIHERHRLSDISYDTLIDADLDIHAWPVARSEWESAKPRAFVQAARQTGHALLVEAA
jgi:predicted nucleotidyltransferase